MFKNKKKSLILIPIFLFILILIVPFFVFAQERLLNIDYPEFGGWKPETEQSYLPSYIKYIFDFAVAISGLIVFGILVYGGIRWMTSAGNPTVLSDARNQIFLGFIGLVLLLGSWLIFSTIDYELTLFDLSGLSKIRVANVPGIYLSPELSFPSEKEIEAGEKKAYHLITDTSNLKPLIGDEKIKSLKIRNVFSLSRIVTEKEDCPLGTKQGELKDCLGEYVGLGPYLENAKCCVPEKKDEEISVFYGIVAHEKKDMQGNCEFYRSVGLEEKAFPDITFEAESITVFQEAKNGQGEIIIYDSLNFMGEHATLTAFSAADFWKPLPNEFKYNIRSIEIPSNLLLVLRGDERCIVVKKNSADIKEYNINRCGFESVGGIFNIGKPCVTHYAVFALELTGTTLPKESKCKAGSNPCEDGWASEPPSKCNINYLVSGVICCCEIPKTDPEDPDPEELIEPNIITGKTCNDLCADKGMNCKSIGTDSLAKNNKFWNYNSFTGCQHQHSPLGGCGLTMPNTDGQCGSEEDKKSSNWTRCYCTK